MKPARTVRWGLATPAILLLLPVLAASILRVLPIDLAEPAIQVLAVLPWLILPTCAALGLASFSKVRTVTALSAILLLVQLLWLFPVDASRKTDCEAARSWIVPVLSLNTGLGQAKAAQLVTLVRSGNIALLNLQEFTSALERGLHDAGLDQLLPYSHRSQARGAGGSAIYSKYPLMPMPSIPGTPHEMITARATIADSELSSTLDITNVHTIAPVDDQSEQWRRDLQALQKVAMSPAPRVLLGDFNASYNHREYRALLAAGNLSDQAASSWQLFRATWPTTLLLPVTTIDHIAISSELGGTQYAVRQISGTDHAAVLSTLSVPMSACG